MCLNMTLQYSNTVFFVVFHPTLTHHQNGPFRWIHPRTVLVGGHTKCLPKFCGGYVICFVVCLFDRAFSQTKKGINEFCGRKPQQFNTTRLQRWTWPSFIPLSPWQPILRYRTRKFCFERKRRGGMDVITCGLMFTDTSDQPGSSIFSIIWTETRNDVTKISFETSVRINISTWLFISGDKTWEPRTLHCSVDISTISKINGTCRILKEHKIKANR